MPAIKETYNIVHSEVLTVTGSARAQAIATALVRKRVLFNVQPTPFNDWDFEMLPHDYEHIKDWMREVGL